MTSVAKIILQNGFLLLVPILLWNAVFAGKLPPGYQRDRFKTGIPKFILTAEAILRVPVFLLPLLLSVPFFDGPEGWSVYFRIGLLLYIVGSAAYYASWILQMTAPDALWSRSLPGFIAPAATPLFWFFGIALMADSTFLPIPYSPWLFMSLSVLFCTVHSIHAVLVWRMRV